jgi:hypothetical protein
MCCDHVMYPAGRGGVGRAGAGPTLLAGKLSRHGGEQGREVWGVAELDVEQGVTLLHAELEERAALLLRVDEFREAPRDVRVVLDRC